MLMEKYETLSQKENIKDENIIKILDYIERHWDIKNEISGRFYEINNKFILAFTDDKIYISYSSYHQVIFKMPIKMFADNIVWLYGSCRDYFNNKK